MKTIKLLTALLLSGLLLSNSSFAQKPVNDYAVAAGIRSGGTSGLSLTINTDKSTGVELIGGIWNNWVSLTGLYELKSVAFNTPSLKWYYGFGGHIAFSTGTYFAEGRKYYWGEQYAAGLDLTSGIEYKIPEIPIAVSFGVKPFTEVYRDGSLFFGLDPGISVKFTFK
jgi:hypothetical protein